MKLKLFAALICLFLVLFAVAATAYLYIFQPVSNNPKPADYSLNGKRYQSEKYNMQVQAVEGWQFLQIPNPFLEYPEAPVQMANRYADAYCLVIPEAIPPSTQLSLAQLAELVRNKINQEHQVLRMGDVRRMESGWSERARFEYTSQHRGVVLAWLVQLDVTDQWMYRTLGWSPQDKYETYLPDFKAIAGSLKPLNPQQTDQSHATAKTFGSSPQ